MTAPDFSWLMKRIKFFFVNGTFLDKESSLEACFYYILTECLDRVRTKLKNVIKSFFMELNSKHRTEKNKN